MAAHRSILSGSVGLQGANRPADVTLIQGLLNAWRIRNGMSTIAVDGIAGSETAGAILTFQRSIGSGSDSRIDSPGPTLRGLLAQHFQAVEDLLYMRIERIPSATGLSTELEPVTTDEVFYSLREYARKLSVVYATKAAPGRSVPPRRPPSLPVS